VRAGQHLQHAASPAFPQRQQHSWPSAKSGRSSSPAQKLPDDQLVTELYLWSIARSPSPAELKLGVEFLASYGDKKNEAAQDLMWALLNSKDFLLVH
jgi:hypothetical protein